MLEKIKKFIEDIKDYLHTVIGCFQIALEESKNEER